MINSDFKNLGEILKCRHHRLEFTGASVVEPSSDYLSTKFEALFFFPPGSQKAPEFMDILDCIIFYTVI